MPDLQIIATDQIVMVGLLRVADGKHFLVSVDSIERHVSDRDVKISIPAAQNLPVERLSVSGAIPQSFVEGVLAAIEGNIDSVRATPPTELSSLLASIQTVVTAAAATKAAKKSETKTKQEAQRVTPRKVIGKGTRGDGGGSAVGGGAVGGGGSAVGGGGSAVGGGGGGKAVGGGRAVDTADKKGKSKIKKEKKEKIQDTEGTDTLAKEKDKTRKQLERFQSAVADMRSSAKGAHGNALLLIINKAEKLLERKTTQSIAKGARTGFKKSVDAWKARASEPEPPVLGGDGEEQEDLNAAEKSKPKPTQETSKPGHMCIVTFYSLRCHCVL